MTSVGTVPVADPDRVVILFPGQGSVFVGMGKQLEHIPAAMDIFKRASEIVGWDVWRTCTEGPAEELDERCQTCIVVTALAALEKVRIERPGLVERASIVAGFSLGEYAAVTFAGAMPLERTLRLIARRSATMHELAAARKGGMITFWITPEDNLEPMLKAAREHAAKQGIAEPVCAVANYLFPGCHVVAGDEVALEWLQEHGSEFGVTKSRRRHVVGGFHTPLMARAGVVVRELLESEPFEKLRVPVVSGFDGRRVTTSEEAAKGLWRGVDAPVRWDLVVKELYKDDTGSTLTISLGPGAALREVLRYTNTRAYENLIQIDV